MEAKLIPTKQRIDVIDAFRGFALAGIVIVHMVEQYLAFPAPEGSLVNLNQGIPDTIVEGFIFFFLRGKFFALFSLLFGLSFFIQMDRAKERGKNFTATFLWKIVLLFGIGYVHSLFYRGDILTIYATLAIFMIPFFTMDKKWAMLAAIVLFLGLGRYITFSVFSNDPIMVSQPLDGKSELAITYFEAAKNGSILDVFESNAVDGIMGKTEFQIGIFGRAYLTIAFFLVGLFLGKIRYFEQITQYKKKTRKALYISLGVFVLSLVIGGGLFALAGAGEGQGPSMDSWISMIAFTFFDLNNVAMTIIILCGFVLIYLRHSGEQFFNKLAPYGRTALTNYFFQSIIGTFIFFGWGLGLLGELQNLHAFGLACIIIVVQAVLSHWWMKNFRYGPLEWLWRSLTYFKIQSFLKN